MEKPKAVAAILIADARGECFEFLEKYQNDSRLITGTALVDCLQFDEIEFRNSIVEFKRRVTKGNPKTWEEIQKFTEIHNTLGLGIIYDTHPRGVEARATEARICEILESFGFKVSMIEAPADGPECSLKMSANIDAIVAGL